MQSRDAHRELECLFVVELRIHLRPVGACEIAVGETASAAGALRDVLACELEVHAVELRTEFAMDPEGRFELAYDVVEATCLESGARRFSVAVHGIADPQHRAAGRAHRLDERW